jgi:transposase
MAGERRDTLGVRPTARRRCAAAVLVEAPLRVARGNEPRLGAVIDPGDGDRGGDDSCHDPVAEWGRDRVGERVAGVGRRHRGRADKVLTVILIPRAVRVYFATQPTNLKKSFDGLTNEIRHALGYDPLGGHVFVFLNRRKNQVKLIVWTRGGFTIVHKRLERGTFTFPARVTGDATSVAIDVHELAMLLEGIDVSRAKSKPRWEPPPRARATTI